MTARWRGLVKIGAVIALAWLPGREPAIAATTAPHPWTVPVRLLDVVAPVPAAWVSQPPSSSMRLAQFRVPGKAAAEDAELVVFYFGEGQGGSAEANIARWQSQFSAPDGKPVKPAVQRLQVKGMPASIVELTGTYTRIMGMGAPAAPTTGQTLLAAILETAKGNLYFQLHGPKAAVAASRTAFLSMIRGITKA
jgi:hypothetical protein